MSKAVFMSTTSWEKPSLPWGKAGFGGVFKARQTRPPFFFVNKFSLLGLFLRGFLSWTSWNMKEKPGLFWENGACFRYFTLSGDLLLMCFSATNFFSSKSLWDVLKIFPSFLSIFTLLVFLSLLLTPLFPNITACPSVNLAYLSNSFIFLNIKKRLFFLQRRTLSSIPTHVGNLRFLSLGFYFLSQLRFVCFSF